MLFVAQPFTEGIEQEEPTRPNTMLIRAKNRAELRSLAKTLFFETFPIGEVYDENEEPPVPRFQKGGSDVCDFDINDGPDGAGNHLLLTKVRIPKKV